MKRWVLLAVVAIVTAGFLGVVGFYFFYNKPAPEQVFRANLTEAQKTLEILRRAELTHRQSAGSYRAISAKNISGQVVYSGGWADLRLPEVDAGTGFDFECLSDDGACVAVESGQSISSGNGIRIDIETGAYECFGSFIPVTTEGFGGELITIACQSD